MVPDRSDNAKDSLFLERIENEGDLWKRLDTRIVRVPEAVDPEDRIFATALDQAIAKVLIVGSAELGLATP
jgi:hypothetical protein